jgi:hypothetical protein
LKRTDNCKYLFGDDIDPVVLTEQYDVTKDELEQIGYNQRYVGTYNYETVQKTRTYVRAIVLDRTHSDTAIISAADSRQRALSYSSPTKGTVYLTSPNDATNDYIGMQWAIINLLQLMTELMKDTLAQEVLLNNKLK